MADAKIFYIKGRFVGGLTKQDIFASMTDLSQQDKEEKWRTMLLEEANYRSIVIPVTFGPNNHTITIEKTISDAHRIALPPNFVS